MIPLQESIFIFGIRIDEAMIASTDLLVAGVCFFAYFKLKQLTLEGKAFQLFRLYFLVLGLATTWGALVTHAFFYLFSQPWRVPGWLTGMVAAVLFSFASIEHTKGVMTKTFRSVLNIVVGIEVIVMMALTITTLNFVWTSLHSAFALLVIASPLHLLNWIRNKNEASRLILVGVIIFCVSGIIFLVKLSPHAWFNHVDVAHTFIAMAVYLFYRSAILFPMNEKEPAH